MSSAAPAASAAEQSAPSTRRKARPGLTRRSGLQLLAGLLIVAGIPVIATVRILDANALRNQEARADAALTAQLQYAGDELSGVSGDASTRADDLFRLPVLQRAMLTDDRATITRVTRRHSNMAVYVGTTHVAGRLPAVAL